MNNDSKNSERGEMLPEYDFSNAVCGKYAQRFSEGTNMVVLSPDVAKAFPTSEAVNEALRDLLRQRRSGKETG